jgi:alkaline phosphatase
MTKITGLILILWLASIPIMAQSFRLKGHSHNDYEQSNPFFTAHANKMGSIETDIWAVDGVLYVAHDLEKITPEATFENLYLQPIIEEFKKNDGRPWADSDDLMILLVDLKSSFDPTLDILVKKLSNHKNIFDPGTNPFAVRVVISGSMPPPSFFHKYPEWIYFDGRLAETYSKKHLKRVFMISNSYKNYAQWDGNGQISESDLNGIIFFVQEVHAKGKKARLWGAPDHPDAWKTFLNAGLDYINTDQPALYHEKMFE